MARTINMMNFFDLLFLLKQRKTLGEPAADVVDGPSALEFNKSAFDSISSPQPATKYLLAARDGGLVREENDNRVVSREDTTELTEVLDTKHLGDFSDAVSFFNLIRIESTKRSV